MRLLHNNCPAARMSKVAAQDEVGNSSVYDGLRIASTAIYVGRRLWQQRKNKDEWTEADPVETSMKKKVEGYYIWCPGQPKVWFQELADTPADTVAEWELAIAVGSIEIERNIPHKDIWEDYTTECAKACAAGDGSDGEEQRLSIFCSGLL